MQTKFSRRKPLNYSFVWLQRSIKLFPTIYFQLSQAIVAKTFETLVFKLTIFHFVLLTRFKVRLMHNLRLF